LETLTCNPGRHRRKGSSTHRSAAIVIAAALAIAAVVAAASALDHGPNAAALPMVARILRVNVVGDRYAPKAGDRLYADAAVLVGRRGRRLGAAAFACTVTGADGRLHGSCTTTLLLPLGRLTGRWPLARSRTARTGRITGGSGLYRGVRGRFVLGPTRPNGDTPFTVEVRP
jgi:hypothetical protein